MLKMRLITLAVTAAPFAFLLAKVCLGTKAGGMNDGGSWA
jgi:hypothetical protein